VGDDSVNIHGWGVGNGACPFLGLNCDMY
jgi:hypothetical protein